MKKSCKGSMCIGYLEYKIDELDYNSDLSRSAKFNRAISKVANLTIEEIVAYSKELKSFKSHIPTDVVFPTALQVTVNEDLQSLLNEFEIKIKKALNLSNLQTRFELEIIFYIYLRFLEAEALTLRAEKSGIYDRENISGPEMVKILVEMIMLRRDQDMEFIGRIKTALIEWTLEGKL